MLKYPHINKPHVPREMELPLGIFGCESHIVEEAEAAALGWLCVMPRRPEFSNIMYVRSILVDSYATINAYK